VRLPRKGGRGGAVIEKVVKISNLGRFMACQPRGDAALKSVTLVYADNGRGKTTLAAILRSLSLNDPIPVTEREAVSGSGRPYVKLIASGSPVIFDSGAWTGSPPEVEVFDAEFVDRNIYSGSAIEPSHRKNMHTLAIGAAGVQLAERVDGLADRITRLNTPIAQAKAEVSAIAGEWMSADDFCRLAVIPEVDERIEEVTGHLKAAREKSLIEVTTKLSVVSVSAIPIGDTLDHLAATLDNVSADAIAATQEHINDCLDESGETWLRQGLGYLADHSSCPFCKARVDDNALVAAYRQYFDQAYADHTEVTKALDAQVAVVASPSSTAAIQRTLDANARLRAIWKDFNIESPEALDTAQLQEDLLALKDGLQAALSTKGRTPLVRVPIAAGLHEAIETWYGWQRQILAYNNAVEGTNVEIDALKEAAGEADVAALEAEASRLRLAKLRGENVSIEACNKYLELTERKRGLEREKSRAWAELGEQSAELIRTYATEINDYLEKFGAQFRLCEAVENRHGGSPRMDYCIDIDSCAVPLASSGPGQPCFCNTLSAGDRSALAFALFLVTLKRMGGLSGKVVVLDDPICSLDYGRKTSSLQEIGWVCDEASQVIVMSHDALFLKEVWRRTDPSKRTTLKLERRGDNTAIVLCDIDQETRSRYSADYARVTDYVGGKIPASVDVARSIRPLLEGNIRLRFPGRVGGHNLGGFLAEVDSASSSDPIACLKPKLPEIGAVNDYAKMFHHDENPSADERPVNDTELRSFAKRALNVVSEVLVAGLT